jgi:lipid II:glycine glycyltransferase (peptidoglycan interpeptide bridge formation enzyme)
MTNLISLSPTKLSECDNSETFLQSGFWGTFKGAFAWQPLAFKAKWRDYEETVLVLQRKFIVYIPWGPKLPLSEERGAVLKEFAESLKSFLPKSTFFIRFDPPWFYDLPKPFVHAAADIQPPCTVIIDLSKELPIILAQMKSKCRYNIRLGEKKVIIKTADEDGIEIFYSLFLETAKRDGLAIHSIEYYKKLFVTAKNYLTQTNKPILHLYIAEYEGDNIAAIVTLFMGKNATYLYGASSNQNRNVMAPYALQWKAMQDAKEAGCTDYDLFGIPPDDNPSHPMAGLYRFKTGFGGKIIRRSGSYDYPCYPIIYSMFRLYEKTKKNLRDLKKK